MAWIAIIAAGLLEVVWAAAMKQARGFADPRALVVMIVAMAGSIVLLAWAMRTLPLGTAYSAWTGIGALGAFAVGIVVFGEAATPARILAAALILGGLILMKLSPDT